MKKFFLDKKGSSALEYGIIAALISIVILVGLQSVSTSMNNTYSTISSHMSEAEKKGK